MYNVIDYLENSLNKFPHKIAVIEEDQQITYQELGNLSQRVGTYIAKNNFNEPIIIFMDKGINALVSFMASIYAGCYYTLINPELPLNRITHIQETIKAKLVITNEQYSDLAKNAFPDLTVCCLADLENTEIDCELLNAAYQKHIDTDPLYVNFTSGSTGIPKGVVISHRSVIDFIDIFTTTFNFQNTDIIANQAPFDFDVSVKDIYSSLKMGATLLIVPKKYFSNPALLLDYLCANQATTLTWAVSALCLITTFHGLDYKVPSTVNKVLFSGEVMPLKHLNEWLNKLPNTMFVNLYGPTEITCNCLYHIIDRARTYEKIPVGKPFPNERVFLLDDNNQLITEPHKTGEICVSGTCVGLGYYNNLEATQSHFIYESQPYIRTYYKTGDLAYLNAEDEYVFMGRKDYQIKYLGHRIELEEIEKAIMDVEGIVRCCCIFDEEKSKLYGFYIGDIPKAELNTHLKQVLPIFMIPTKLIQVDKMPLTKNGKIDRKKLKEQVI